jgi:CBS domain-containing protein
MNQVPTKVKEIMVTDVVTIEPSKTANEAAEKMSKTH